MIEEDQTGYFSEIVKSGSQKVSIVDFTSLVLPQIQLKSKFLKSHNLEFFDSALLHDECDPYLEMMPLEKFDLSTISTEMKQTIVADLMNSYKSSGTDGEVKTKTQEKIVTSNKSEQKYEKSYDNADTFKALTAENLKNSKHSKEIDKSKKKIHTVIGIDDVSRRIKTPRPKEITSNSKIESTNLQQNSISHKNIVDSTSSDLSSPTKNMNKNTHRSRSSAKPSAKTQQPSSKPSHIQPSAKPSHIQPSAKPSHIQPSAKPSHIQPSAKPSHIQPSAKTQQPSAKPSHIQPSAKTQQPSAKPSHIQPSAKTQQPSAKTQQPSAKTQQPSAKPSHIQPSAKPSHIQPSAKPSHIQPSAKTQQPSAKPSHIQPSAKTQQPSAKTQQPSAKTQQPSAKPSHIQPSAKTQQPSAKTQQPSAKPPAKPSAKPQLPNVQRSDKIQPITQSSDSALTSSPTDSEPDFRLDDNESIIKDSNNAFKFTPRIYYTVKKDVNDFKTLTANTIKKKITKIKPSIERYSSKPSSDINLKNNFSKNDVYSDVKDRSKDSKITYNKIEDKNHSNLYLEKVKKIINGQTEQKMNSQQVPLVKETSTQNDDASQTDKMISKNHKNDSPEPSFTPLDSKKNFGEKIPPLFIDEQNNVLETEFPKPTKHYKTRVQNELQNTEDESDTNNKKFKNNNLNKKNSYLLPSEIKNMVMTPIKADKNGKLIASTIKNSLMSEKQQIEKHLKKNKQTILEQTQVIQKTPPTITIKNLDIRIVGDKPKQNQHSYEKIQRNTKSVLNDNLNKNYLWKYKVRR